MDNGLSNYTNYTNYTKGRFEVGYVSTVLQDVFRNVARRLGKKICKATEEALQDWVEKHFDEANIPLDGLTVPQREFDFDSLGLPEDVKRGVMSWLEKWHTYSKEKKADNLIFLRAHLGENQARRVYGWLEER